MQWQNSSGCSRKPRLALTKKLIAFAAVIALGSCNSTGIDGCAIFGPISGSKLDTPQTRAQVDEHNAKGVGACGWNRRRAQA